jgi:hypothetical protein
MTENFIAIRLAHLTALDNITITILILVTVHDADGRDLASVLSSSSWRH